MFLRKFYGISPSIEQNMESSCHYQLHSTSLYVHYISHVLLSLLFLFYNNIIIAPERNGHRCRSDYIDDRPNNVNAIRMECVSPFTTIIVTSSRTQWMWIGYLCFISLPTVVRAIVSLLDYQMVLISIDDPHTHTRTQLTPMNSIISLNWIDIKCCNVVLYSSIKW